GELEHRRIKKFYARTNKIHLTRQIANLQQREGHFASSSVMSQKEGLPQASIPEVCTNKQSSPRHRDASVMQKDSTRTSLGMHHYISDSRNHWLDIDPWLAEHREDLALTDFLVKLHNHFLGRLRQPDTADDGHIYPRSEQIEVSISNHRLYNPKTCRINYTTYDMRRSQDVLNPRVHADILTLAADINIQNGRSESGGHPFRYARILGIYHADLIYEAKGKQPIHCNKQVLFVRWYRQDHCWKSGFNRRRYHRLEFLPATETDAFGFLDPDDVIRATHIIPAFAHGRTYALLPGTTIARPAGELDDWRYFYVNL
ncbi:hypothetical protein K474DRAFT_1752796, partial [Panus rudis PR-1116 ss-1]